jgi:hypothetical protein
MVQSEGLARDTRQYPWVGDTFRTGVLWAKVERVHAHRVVVRVIRPGIGERTVSLAIPLPAALVPTPWTRTDLAWARAQMIARLRPIPPRGSSRSG